jgi:hypothetical protein
MRPKMLKKLNYFFKEQFLIHLNCVLEKNSVVKYAHRSVN